MRPFADRNPVVIGVAGLSLGTAITVLAFQYHSLPLINDTDRHSAYFAEASGLRVGASVQVAGVDVGRVTNIALDGPKVLVDFDTAGDIHLGDRTEATITTKSLLGAKALELTPRGERPLEGPIQLERTKPAYQLTDAVGELTTTLGDLNTDQLAESMRVLSETFADTPADLKAAVAGMARFSATLNERDQHLRDLLANARKATTVLAERTDKVVGLIADTNVLLIELQSQSSALDQISGNLSATARQLSGLVEDNRTQLRPALDKLNGVLTIIDNRKDRVRKSISLLKGYLMSLGESVASGPFFKSYLANLIPGQFIQPFIDAAFSDLGLDPNVLLPSERTDPTVGQRATPALPVPFPRTGQSGEPHLTLPDAITGKPGDPRYPYREPLPAPPPGGPPPGPPAQPQTEGDTP